MWWAAACNATSTREAYFKASLGYIVRLGSAWAVDKVLSHKQSDTWAKAKALSEDSQGNNFSSYIDQLSQHFLEFPNFKVSQ